MTGGHPSGNVSTRFSRSGRAYAPPGKITVREDLIFDATSGLALIDPTASEQQWDPMAKRRSNRRWVRQVKTDSTHPPPRTFLGSAQTIARTMSRKDVSPKGLGSAIRMIQYFINR